MSETEERFLWGFGLRDGVILSLIAAATASAKMILRIPLHIPGHFSIVWMFFLVLGCALVPKRGAATTLGILTGILAVLLGFGHEGVLVFFKWAIVGLTLELFQVFMPTFAQRWYLSLLAGGAAACVKVLFSLFLFYVLGYEQEALQMAAYIAVTLNLVFGAIGGVLGWALWKRIS